MNNTTFQTYEFLSGRRLSLAVGDEIRYMSSGILTSEYRHPVIATVLELGTPKQGTVRVKIHMDTDDDVAPVTIGIERIDAVFAKFK
jgi:hypothetical protein